MNDQEIKLAVGLAEVLITAISKAVIDAKAANRDSITLSIMAVNSAMADDDAAREELDQAIADAKRG